MLNSLTRDLIQSEYAETTVGSWVLTSGSVTFRSPSQQFCSLVALPQSMGQYGWYCDYI